MTLIVVHVKRAYDDDDDDDWGESELRTSPRHTSCQRENEWNLTHVHTCLYKRDKDDNDAGLSCACARRRRRLAF